ncbi:TniQ family protein [Albimonas sp. CAU 1670]|uniref:TniQ family protein n=1 Tax=Albimonas sp. CAU 1670 TaxID=3032599 RepID=UPI0023DC7A29|nr:TniQ family protein [Albimonas sp. CAU 1670]MDF2234174.1 TniQ family protein [Albimonas sp. CAU 1670]
MTTLFPHLPFDPTETPLSFATRLAALHTGDRLTPFLTDLGIRADRLARGDETSVRRLCEVADVDREAALANTAIGGERRRYRLRGFDISAEFLANPATVFCPACLREDDARDPRAALARRGRLAWTLRPVRTCPAHGIALVQRAPKGYDDKLHELAVRAPERGEALDRLVDAAEARSVSPLQTYVERRLAGEAGPAWLDAQSLEQSARACEMLGALVAVGPKASVSAFTSCDWDRAGRAGFAAAAEGECGIRAALHEVQATFRATGAQPGPRKVFGRFYEWLFASRGEKAPGDIRRILGEHICETMELDVGREVLGVAIEKRRLHSVATLAAETGSDRRTLRNLLAARSLVGKDDHAVYDVFDAEAGRAVAATLQRVAHAIILPKILGCSRPQAEALIDERVLPPLAEGCAPGNKHKAVDARNVETLLALLASEAPTVEAAPIGLVPIAKAAEKAKVAGIEIIHLVLGGFLETVVRLEGQGGFAGVLVDPGEVRREIRHHLIGISPIEAFGRLRIPVRSGWALTDDDLPGGALLSPIEVQGANGRHLVRRFDEAEVDALASRLMSIARLSTETSLSRQEVRRRLRAASVRPMLTEDQIGADLFRVEDLPEDLASELFQDGRADLAAA